MTSHELEITVRADGSIKATTHHVTGSGCLDYIAVLEDLLDAQTIDSAYTQDFVGSSARESVPDVEVQQEQIGLNDDE